MEVLEAPAVHYHDNEWGIPGDNHLRGVAGMTLFCQYEARVFPTPERWSRLPPRQEAKLIRRRLRARRFERWDEEGGPWLEREIAEWIQADIDNADYSQEWRYLNPWPADWRIGSTC